MERAEQRWRRLPRWLIGLGLGLAGLGAAAVIAHTLAIRALKTQIEQTLGEHGDVGEIRMSTTGVEILDLRLRADAAGKPGDWPAAEQLRARRIVIVPDLRGLLSARLRLSSITVDGGYLSLLRSRAGKLRVLPALLEKTAATPASPGAELSIGQIRLVDCAIDFFDATVRQPPLRLRLEKVDADLDDIRLPDLQGRTQVSLDATLKGSRRDGKVTLQGWAELASRDSAIELRLRGVDLVALQPYLIKAAETGVSKGTLDLDLRSTVRSNRLKAPGTLTLSGLELASGNRFMGMPRNAVVAMMKDKNEKIGIQFVLEGDLADPKFSLNENFATRVGSSVAEALGVSLEGLAKGVGSAGRGIGEAVGQLLGK